MVDKPWRVTGFKDELKSRQILASVLGVSRVDLFEKDSTVASRERRRTDQPLLTNERFYIVMKRRSL
jgi:hypothetical protein